MLSVEIGLCGPDTDCPLCVEVPKPFGRDMRFSGFRSDLGDCGDWLRARSQSMRVCPEAGLDLHVLALGARRRMPGSPPCNPRRLGLRVGFCSVVRAVADRTSAQ